MKTNTKFEMLNPKLKKIVLYFDICILDLFRISYFKKIFTWRSLK